jgi:hypothetical protein
VEDSTQEYPESQHMIVTVMAESNVVYLDIEFAGTVGELVEALRGICGPFEAQVVYTVQKREVKQHGWL